MTNKEAISVLKVHREFFNEEIGEALGLAIVSLVKQIPEKTKTIDWDGDMLDKHCGICEYNLKGNERHWNYCPCCGRAIDWSDSDDK